MPRESAGLARGFDVWGVDRFLQSPMDRCSYQIIGYLFAHLAKRAFHPLPTGESSRGWDRWERPLLELRVARPRRKDISQMGDIFEYR
jgi:hypothetical protein